jgi:hypothetical protein
VPTNPAPPEVPGTIDRPMPFASPS